MAESLISQSAVTQICAPSGPAAWLRRAADGLARGMAAARALDSGIELTMTREERAEDLRRRFFDG